jgi:hypothetical protein
VFGVKNFDEDDSKRILFDENIGKVSVGIKYGARLVMNQSQLK